MDASEMGIVQYILQMCDQLVRYHEEAKEIFTEAQQAWKRWYDQHVCQKEQLLAMWQHPA